MNCDECANFEPKRKQTGVICRECHVQRCVSTHPEWGKDPTRCPYEWGKVAVWQPFYGKVVE